jgi:DNA-binding winged helix-turn-helix (wHTH) protein/Flp pilus assembly protein TadD
MDTSVADGLSYEFGPFLLDPMRRLLACEGNAVALTPTLFDTLLYLVENSGRVVSREELLDAVWPGKVVEDSNVSQTIFTLRKALDAAGAPSRLIVTQPGRGYRLAQAVRVVRGGGPAPAAPEPKPDLPLTSTTKGRQRAVAAAGLAVAVAVAALAVVLALRAAASPGASVVLADFQSLAGDASFNKTLTEAARIDLLQSPAIAVLPERRVQDTLALMTRSRDETLTPSVAREVCARNNASAAIVGSVAQVGTGYLLMLSATDCAEGGVLAAEKAEVLDRDGLLAAMDRMVSDLRGRLGESVASIGKFSVPLARARTASFEALKAYSEGLYAARHGRRIDSIPLLRHAVDLDPAFAAAYADLAVVHYNIKEFALAAKEMDRAFALRGNVDEREKLHIEVSYNTIVTGDIDEGIRVLRVWTGLYPRDADAWSSLANKESWVGQYGAAMEDGRLAVTLAPDAESPYVVLARACLHAGDFVQAQAVAAKAQARHLDGDDLHGVLYQLDIARGDDAAAQGEMAWAHGRPAERSMLVEAGQAAFRHGQVRRGLDLFAQALAKGRAYGLGNFMAAPNARLLYDMGLPEMARSALAEVPAGYDSEDYRYSLAAFGDEERAAALLRDDLARAPNDTLLGKVYAAEQRAATALRHGRAADAVAALSPALPYDLRTYDIPYLRGAAWLAAGDGAHAAAEFRKVLDHPGVEAVSVHYPLARLGLARALTLAHEPTAARLAYSQFLDEWKNADAEMPLLDAARAELARLGTAEDSSATADASTAGVLSRIVDSKHR